MREEVREDADDDARRWGGAAPPVQDGTIIIYR